MLVIFQPPGRVIFQKELYEKFWDQSIWAYKNNIGEIQQQNDVHHPTWVEVALVTQCICWSTSKEVQSSFSLSTPHPKAGGDADGQDHEVLEHQNLEYNIEEKSENQNWKGTLSYIVKIWSVPRSLVCLSWSGSRGRAKISPSWGRQLVNKKDTDGRWNTKWGRKREIDCR